MNCQKLGNPFMTNGRGRMANFELWHESLSLSSILRGAASEAINFGGVFSLLPHTVFSANCRRQSCGSNTTVVFRDYWLQPSPYWVAYYKSALGSKFLDSKSCLPTKHHDATAMSAIRRNRIRIGELQIECLNESFLKWVRPHSGEEFAFLVKAITKIRCKRSGEKAHTLIRRPEIGKTDLLSNERITICPKY